MELGGPELARIAEAVGDHRVFVYVGTVERLPGGGSVYATLVAIDPERGIVGAHRDVMPTYEERLVWAQGDGHGLRAHVTNGIRVGGLNCWENWLPQARQAVYAEAIDLQVAVWPGSVRLTRDITRFIALEQVFRHLRWRAATTRGHLAVVPPPAGRARGRSGVALRRRFGDRGP